jgi:hypothetical protein
MLTHRHLDLDGCSVFFREAGPPGAPVVLLPHGYPCFGVAGEGVGWPSPIPSWSLG